MTSTTLSAIPKKTLLWLVCGLIALQMLLTVFVVHRESLTFDEDNHMFAGYMMWHAGDYGLNPEHPPLVKLLATLPLLGQKLWVPELKGRDFKTEAYLSGRDWIARNDGDRNKLVFEMRLAAGLLAIGLSLTVFFAAREMFGDMAGVIALALIAFDPNVLAHSALVTTDIGVSLFFLASVWAFYRYVSAPSVARLLVAGGVSGLLVATKHSGILLAPMLVLLIAVEVMRADKSERVKTLLRLSRAFAVIVFVGVITLWSFYGFRYSARPVGQQMSTTLAEYVAPLGAHIAGIVNGIGRLHLLPESYLIGLVDVERMAQFYPTFALNQNYSHGVWWYFPLVLLIKTTIGLLGLALIALFAIATQRIKNSRALIFVCVPALVYLGVAIVSNMNIGARHLLPFYAFLFVLTGAGAAAIAPFSRTWMVVCTALLAAHIGSSLMVYPNEMTYANEAWGGPENTHKLLSDANVDWAQQLYQVKAWQTKHPGEECWFAYFAYPEVQPETYGISCHHLPTIDTMWLGGAENIQPIVSGAVLVSAGDLSGCEWADGKLNPYNALRSKKPSETIDDAVFVYEGQIDLHVAAAVARAQNAETALTKRDMQTALKLGEEAARIDPRQAATHQAYGDALAAAGKRDEARIEWQKGLDEAMKLDPGAQGMYVPDFEAKLKK